MNHQYFDNNENLESNPQKITFFVKGVTLELTTDNGVFSKNGVDFGSRTLIKWFKPENKKTILDVGCGYGPIGLSIANIYPDTFVDMIDVNPRAIRLATLNRDENNIKNAEIFASNVYENITKKYDIIVSNPPIRAGKDVVRSITLGAIEDLNEGGEMWCVVQKKQGAPSLLKAISEVYASSGVIAIANEYYVIVGKK